MMGLKRFALVLLFAIVLFGNCFAFTEATGVSFNSSGTISSPAGYKIYVKSNITLTAVNKKTEVTGTTAYLYNSEQILINSSSFIGDTATFNNLLTADSNYYITVGSGTSSYTRYLYTSDPGYPILGTYVNWVSATYGTEGVLATDYSNAQNIISIELTSSDLSQGIKVIYPNGGEVFSPDFIGDGNKIFYFDVNSYDSNYVYVKPYLSLNAEDKTTFLYDLNLRKMALDPTADANCGWDYNGFKTLKRCYFDVNLTKFLGLNYNNYYLDLNMYKTGFSALDSSDSSFRYGYGYLNLFLLDENSSARLQPTITINGNNYSSLVDALGNLKIDFNTSWNSSNSEYSILTSMLGKTEREFDFDLNRNGTYDYNLTLLDSNKGTAFDFTYYKPDLTICSNCLITHYINGNRFAGRKQTDALGNVSFFLNGNDSGYYATVNDGITEWIYSMTRVESKIPKDELTGSNVCYYPGDGYAEGYYYALSVGGLAVQNYPMLNSDINVFIQSNTVDYYDLTYSTASEVGCDKEYLSRSYSIKTYGQAVLYLLQPYLVEGTDYTVFNVFNANDNKPLENILIRIKKYMPEGLITVQETSTDASGIASASLLLNNDYLLYFYNGTNLVYSASLRPVQYIYYIYLNLDSNVSSSLQDFVSINFFPASSSIQSATTLDLNQVIKSQLGEINSINTKVIQDGTIKSDSNATITGNCSASSCNFNQNINVNLLDSNSIITVVTTVSTDSGTYQKRQDYFFMKSTDKSIFNTLKAIKNSILGDFGALLLALLLTVAIVGAFALQIGLNPSALLFPTAGCIIFFTLIDWIDWRITAFAIFIGIIAFVFTRRTT